MGFFGSDFFELDFFGSFYTPLVVKIHDEILFGLIFQNFVTAIGIDFDFLVTS